MDKLFSMRKVIIGVTTITVLICLFVPSCRLHFAKNWLYILVYGALVYIFHSITSALTEDSRQMNASVNLVTVSLGIFYYFFLQPNILFWLFQDYPSMFLMRFGTSLVSVAGILLVGWVVYSWESENAWRKRLKKYGAVVGVSFVFILYLNITIAFLRHLFF